MRKGSFHFGRNRKALTASFTAVTYGRNSYCRSLDESEAGNIWDPSGNTPSGTSYRCGFTFSLHFNQCMTLGHLNWTIWSPQNLFLQNIFSFYSCVRCSISLFLHVGKRSGARWTDSEASLIILQGRAYWYNAVPAFQRVRTYQYKVTPAY